MHDLELPLDLAGSSNDELLLMTDSSAQVSRDSVYGVAASLTLPGLTSANRRDRERPTRVTTSATVGAQVGTLNPNGTATYTVTVSNDNPPGTTFVT